MPPSLLQLLIQHLRETLLLLLLPASRLIDAPQPRCAARDRVSAAIQTPTLQVPVQHVVDVFHCRRGKGVAATWRRILRVQELGGGIEEAVVEGRSGALGTWGGGRDGAKQRVVHQDGS